MAKTLRQAQRDTQKVFSLQSRLLNNGCATCVLSTGVQRNEKQKESLAKALTYESLKKQLGNRNILYF